MRLTTRRLGWLAAGNWGWVLVVTTWRSIGFCAWVSNSSDWKVIKGARIGKDTWGNAQAPQYIMGSNT